MRHDRKACRESGRECDGCRLSSLIDAKPSVDTSKVSVHGFDYVLHLAVNSGITLSQIARDSGVSRKVLTDIWYGRKAMIWQSTATRLRTTLLSYIPEEVGV